MKNLKTYLGCFLFIVFSLGFIFGSEQILDPSFEFTHGPVEIDLAPDSIGSFAGTIFNISTDTIEIQLMKSMNTLPQGWTASICVGSVCYSQTVDSITVYIGPSDSLSTSVLVFASQEGQGNIEFGITDYASPNDVISVDIHFYFNESHMSNHDKENRIQEAVFFQNIYPNPFNPIIMFDYFISHITNVKIDIYDCMGRKIRTLVNETQSAGSRKVRWNARGDNDLLVSAGIYHVMLETGISKISRKVVLIK